MRVAHSLIVIALNAVPLQGATAEPEIIVLLEGGDEAGLLEGRAVPPGDDWVVRASLYSGAQNAVASLWPVDDPQESLIQPVLAGSIL